VIRSISWFLNRNFQLQILIADYPVRAGINAPPKNFRQFVQPGEFIRRNWAVTLLRYGRAKPANSQTGSKNIWRSGEPCKNLPDNSGTGLHKNDGRENNDKI
jgi:hypothetical protein